MLVSWSYVQYCTVLLRIWMSSSSATHIVTKATVQLAMLHALFFGRQDAFLASLM